MRVRFVIGMTVLAVFCSGCMTCVQRQVVRMSKDDTGRQCVPQPYQGTRGFLRLWNAVLAAQEGWWPETATDQEKCQVCLMLGFTVVDFPFTFVTDTALVPYDLCSRAAGGAWAQPYGTQAQAIDGSGKQVRK